MKYRHLLLLLSACLFFLFSSCEVDFSPNANWTETTVVYCVLDQDDDTSYVRVQKCYLGEGNQYAYSSIMDSSNYPEGSLDVKILALKDNVVKTEFIFDYKLLTNKDEGDFAAPNQPVYVCRTAGALDTACTYKLIVVNHFTGDTLATASTRLVGDCEFMDRMLNQPLSSSDFHFTGTQGSRKCALRWYSLPRARQYQPVIRFYYHDFLRQFNGSTYDTLIVPHTILINGPVIKSSATSYYENCFIYEQSYLSVIKDSVLNRHIDWSIVENPEDYSLVIDPHVDIFLNCCSEDLAAYIYSHQAVSGANQQAHIYTNIQGGLGVFASRRTHLMYSRTTPAHNTEGSYNYSIKQLGVGF